MTSSEDIRKEIARPEIARMKMVADGLRVGAVMGNRVLVEPIMPKTELDDVEKKGLLYIPDAVKKDNTPRPSTGIVLQVGNGVQEEFYNGKSNEDGSMMYEKEPVAPGAMVFFSKYAGTSLTLDKKELLILDYSDIACTLEATEGALADTVAREVADSTPPVLAGAPRR